MSTLTTADLADAPSLPEVAEALRWATAGGVRQWDFLDKLLDEYIEARAH